MARACKLGIALLSLLFGSASTAFIPPIARIDTGIVIGTSVTAPSATAPVNVFRAIPCAAPPRRFSVPRRPARWERPLNATVEKPICIQQYPDYGEISEVLKGAFPSNNYTSEDCLYLNVYAPASPASKTGRAVLFFIHGGAFQTGGNTDFNGVPWAAYEDIVAVSFNYRLNVFGFPNAPELPAGQRNLGMLDQRLALDWVRRNIHAFGGDPAKVTIVGPSAGAFSVDALLTSYPRGSKPPFQGGIMQTGQYGWGGIVPNLLADTTSSWYTLVSILNCSSSQSNLTCVRNAPAETIKAIIEKVPLIFNPQADNVTLMSQPGTLREQGVIADIPILGGTAAQEGQIFVSPSDNLTTFMNTYFGFLPLELREEILTAYPRDVDGLDTDFDIAAQIYTEYVWQCNQAIYLGRTAAAGTPAWRYYYNASFPNITPPSLPYLKAYHGSDSILLYLSPYTPGTTAQQFALNNHMRSAWARFIKNPRGGPGWPAVGMMAEDVGVLGDAGATKSGGVTPTRATEIDKRCALYEKLIWKDGRIGE